MIRHRTLHRHFGGGGNGSSGYATGYIYASSGRQSQHLHFKIIRGEEMKEKLQFELKTVFEKKYFSIIQK